ncbi:CopG family transcriptional regulator [Nostoc flagelliforme FACHB-838]|uniref:CopG family transcriptional regulator n=1 Tax=Nostoc flagelliforme FACHB-838 TaxID=2692904 RepID=A0ABR8E8N5_9NOSO|nr:CopG family transcriptional regulator [Nostoc flagelliforme]MBD2536968.1 CopG family transcriptional regulator [Nostoc flagelliforme FACHB-838]
MNKKWAIKQLTIDLTPKDEENLEKYCLMTGRSATNVIRELILSLPTEDEKVISQ